MQTVTPGVLRRCLTLGLLAIAAGACGDGGEPKGAGEPVDGAVDATSAAPLQDGGAPDARLGQDARPPVSDAPPVAPDVRADGSDASDGPKAIGDASSQVPPGACNGIALPTTRIRRVGVPAIPKAEGGTLVDGVYELVASELVGEPYPTFVRFGLSIVNGTVEYAMDAIDDKNVLVAEQRFNARVSTSGNTISFKKTCNLTGDFSWTYTAKPDKLVLITGLEVAYTFVRKP